MSKSKQTINPLWKEKIVTIHSMMCSYAGKYSDVNIHVGDKVFKSNRWALASVSEYFEAQFERWASSKEDEVSQSFTLHEVDAEIFEKILEFMNSGQIDISDSNVNALLHANDYLLLRNNLIQEECISYLEIAVKKSQPILDALKILEFAHTKKNQVLMNLLSPHILKHMDHFLKDPKFKEISFDCVNAIVECKNSLQIEDYTLLLAINTWIDHSRVERKKNRKWLMRNIDAINISAFDYLSLMDHYEDFIDSMTPGEGVSSAETASDLHLVYPTSSFTNSEVNGSETCYKEIEMHKYCSFCDNILDQVGIIT